MQLEDRAYPGESTKNYLILSKYRPYGKNSFLLGGPQNRYNPKCPPPINLSYDEIYTTRAMEFK